MTLLSVLVLVACGACSAGDGAAVAGAGSCAAGGAGHSLLLELLVMPVQAVFQHVQRKGAEMGIFSSDASGRFCASCVNSMDAAVLKFDTARLWQETSPCEAPSSSQPDVAETSHSRSATKDL